MIEAIYENGVFRPVEPVELPEGARVEVFPIELLPSTAGGNGTSSISGSRPLVGEKLTAFLAQLDELPYQPNPDGRTDISSHHDDLLYPTPAKEA